MESIPDSDFLTEQEKEDARKETNVEFIKAYNARSFSYPKTAARKSAKDIQAFAEDKLVAKSFTEMRCELPGAPRSTFLMVFSPDGTKVASTHGNHNIYVSDVRSGKNIKTLVGHPRTPWCIAFHPTSNQIIASGCLGGQVRIWDLSGGSEVWSSDNSTVIASLTFHPEDRLLVIATYNQLHFWDWSKPEPFATVSTATTKEKVRYVAFDPLGHKLVTGISNNTTPQSRWERAQRCPASSLLISSAHHRTPSQQQPTSPTPLSAPQPYLSNRYSPALSPDPLPPMVVNISQHNGPPIPIIPLIQPTGSTTRPTNTTTATSTSTNATPPSPFSNIPPYTGRSQRSRLTSRILAHYRAFPPRSGPDAHLYQTILGGTTTSAVRREQETRLGGHLPATTDVDAALQPALTTSSLIPEHVLSPIVETTAPVAFTHDTSPSRAIPPRAPISRATETTSSLESLNRRRLDLGRSEERGAGSSDTLAERVIEEQQPEEEQRTAAPLAAGRREPLSSVPDRERRISACYRNLVREYEQLVHRYLQIYRPPVMIDRGTDPMDLNAASTSRPAPISDPQPSTSTNQPTVKNPANIQPVSSNSHNNPTDMRSVCEFTSTDPSVLSPLRNCEVEAARRNNLEQERRQLNPSDIPSTSSGRNKKKPAPEVKSILRHRSPETKAVKTYNRSSDRQIIQTVAPSTSDNQTEEPAAEINLQTAATPEETNQQQVADGTGESSANQQDDQVNDLITNLTIISSMAVQLKSVAERLTLHKDNKASQPEEEVSAAGPSTEENIETTAVETSSEIETSAETPNVAADIKLAKKMVDKIVEIMETFSNQTSQPSTSTAEASSSSRKRPHALFKTKSSRKPLLLVDSSSDDDDTNSNDSSTKRVCLDREQVVPTAAETTDVAAASDDDDQTNSTQVTINDNASDTTSTSMYNNVAPDDIASASDFAERRPWNYNRELEQLVTDLLHGSTTNEPPSDSQGSVFLDVDQQHVSCRICDASLENQCIRGRNFRRRFFCHRLSAFHPTRFRSQRMRTRHSIENYFQPLPAQDPAAIDEVINFSQRSSETPTTPETTLPATSDFDPPIPSYHPFDPPPELDTINPEHIGIGNMYSNIVQELETSLSDFRNVRCQRRLGETSDMLGNFSERLESIMTQSHAILRNLSTSIDEQNGAANSGRRGSSSATPNTNQSWSPASNRDSGDSLSSPSSISNATAPRNPANPQSVNADHSYPRPANNMSPLMASLHLTVSHIWRQARLLRTQMDSIERIDRAMLELAQLRVMRQMFADLSRYFSSVCNTVGPHCPQDTTTRHNRASNAPDRSGSAERGDQQRPVNSTATGTSTTSNASTPSTAATDSSTVTVNSMRRMRISDNNDSTQTSTSSTSSTTRSSSHSGLPPRVSHHHQRKMYPYVMVMHPRHFSCNSSSRRYPSTPYVGLSTMRGCRGGASGSVGGGSRAIRYLSTHNRWRNLLIRHHGSAGTTNRLLATDGFVDVAEPGRGRTYMNLFNPETFPSLSHRLSLHLIEHGRLISHHQHNTTANQPPQPAADLNNNQTHLERVLNMRLNTCRNRLHRLFGGRTQYASDTNRGRESQVTRDGASRFPARHTLCVMLDTLSRFMEAYGTGLVGISSSFRTYLREVIDLARLLSEVLLLQIVDTIPPPTGMMLDPERENLSQRIDDMCSRMILTRLSSQSQPLTRSLRLMRLNVRFFSHAIQQNRLIEERSQPTTTTPDTAEQPPSSSNPVDTTPTSPPSAADRGESSSPSTDRYSQNSILNALSGMRRYQRARFAAQRAPMRRAHDGNAQSVSSRLTTIREINRNLEQEVMQRAIHRQRQELPTSMDSAVVRRFMDAAGRGRTNMSELLFQRLGGSESSLVEERTNRNEFPIVSSSSIQVPVYATSSPYINSLLHPQQPSAATTENQRFLDSLGPAPTATPPSPSPTPRSSSTPSRYNLTQQRVQQQQQQQHQQRRLYMRSSSFDDYSSSSGGGTGTGGGNGEAGQPPEVMAEAAALMFGRPRDGVESRGGLYPMYYRNNPMWNVPEVHLNNHPLPSSRDPYAQDSASQPIPTPPQQQLQQRSFQRFMANRERLDEQLYLHHHQRGVGGGPHSFISRPRFLHPLYAWSGLNPYPFEGGAEVEGERGGAGGQQGDSGASGRIGGEQVYESDIIAAVTPNHRIQVWEFNRAGEGNGIIPNITNALKNVVVSECKIHNDASVDIASDGSVLVTLLPSNSYLNITNRLGIYSLEWETLGQILYITTFDQNAVSVSLSPLSRHLVVGLASRRVSIMPSEQWTLARIFLLDGRRMAFGRLSLMKEIEQSRDTNFVMSVNCIRWLPTSGQGLVFATNTGQLRILN